MKKYIRIIAVILVIALAAGTSPASIFAADENDLLIKRSLRIYSSLDQQSHQVQVTEHKGKIYINAADLTALLQGDVFIWQKKTGFYKFLENDTEIVDLIKKGMGIMGISTKAPYYYILKNGITKQNLRYDLSSGEWMYFSTQSHGLASEIKKMPQLAPPIVENDTVFVELLPFAKALGITVNVTAKGDGLSFYIPQVTMDYLAGVVSEVFDLDSGVVIPWRDDESILETFGTEVALYFDQVGDILTGELIPFVTGNYDADRFEEAMIATLSVYGEETANYVEKLYDGVEFTRNIIDTDTGLWMLSQMDNGYAEYLQSVNKDAKLKDLIQTDSPGLSGMQSAAGILVSLYSRQLCLANMVVANVESANNVFGSKSDWLPQQVKSLSGRTTSSIVNDLVDEYYHGLSGRTIKRAVMEGVLEFAAGQYAGLAPEALKDSSLWKQLFDASAYGLNKALASLNAVGITIEIYEEFSGYEHGTLHEMQAYREVQDILGCGVINCLNSSSADTAEKAQYIYDCAKLAFLARYAYTFSNSKKIEPLSDRLFSINPREAALSAPESIEKLSCATDELIRPLIFDRASYEFNFWDFAEALGMEIARNDGSFGLGNSLIADFDADGYPECLMCVNDKALYLTPYYVMLDADAGVVDITTNYNSYGYDAIKMPVLNPDTGHIVLHTSIHTQWENSEYYEHWNGNRFDDGVYGPDGYEMLTERQFKELIQSYTDTPYTGWTIESGSDHLQELVSMLDTIASIVPVVKENIQNMQLDPKMIYRVDGIHFNRDRSIICISSSWATILEKQQGFWFDPCVSCYVDIKSGKVLKKIYPDGPPDPKDEQWLAENGFTY